MISTNWWNTMSNCTTPRPLAMVIQNQKSLIHPTLRQLCDERACLPADGSFLSGGAACSSLRERIKIASTFPKVYWKRGALMWMSQSRCFPSTDDDRRKFSLGLKKCAILNRLRCAPFAML